MCGIAGYFSTRPVGPEFRDTLGRMAAAIRHRGPDGEGYMLDAHAALSHRRLAVIDLDYGDQPMESSDGSVVITYNGEIFNYRALRQSLVESGYEFRTRSDTEVILALYQREGIKGFNRLRGMWALAIWDRVRRQGILARDPLGIKPLFLHRTPESGVYFGSEAKAILAAEPASGRLDVQALHLLFNYRYLPGDETLFQGIRQLGPGQVLVWNADGSTADYQCTPPVIEPGSVLAALEDSVSCHLTADVEVGCYLSGGIDSAAVSRIAVDRLGQGRLQTFTLDTGDDPGEADNAAATAELLGIGNRRFPVPDLDEATFYKLVWHLEVPKINALQLYLLGGEASRYIKVVLSGLGGDELFYGYNAHHWLHVLHSWQKKLPRSSWGFLAGATDSLTPMFTALPWSYPGRVSQILKRMRSPDWPGIYGVLRNLWDNEEMRHEIYGPRMLDAALPDAFEHLRDRWPNDDDPVCAMAKFERQHKLINDLLWQEDRASMAHGLESRVPFIDAGVMNCVDRLSRDELMPRGEKKYLLRQSLSDILPGSVLKRPKSGFQVPAAEFFQQHLAGLARRWLNPKALERTGLFNPAFVQKVLATDRTRWMQWHYFILYLMLTTQIWIDIFEEGSWMPE